MSANCLCPAQEPNCPTTGLQALEVSVIVVFETKSEKQMKGELTGPGRMEGVVVWTGGVVCDWVVKGGAPR